MSTHSPTTNQNETPTQSQTYSQSQSATNEPPPAYDTLSLSPPSASIPTTATTTHSSSSSSPPRKTGLRAKFNSLKAEDTRRKSERVVHVSPEEADRITGLDKHREREEARIEEGRKRGGKGLLGMLVLS